MLKAKIKRKRMTLNVITVFLIFDVFLTFLMFRTSNASYTSLAISEAEMDVALYAFNYGGMEEVENENSSTGQSININLGDLHPGESKYYKFKVYNTNEEGVRKDTSVFYKLKIITTTNVGYKYELFFNQSPFSTNATSIINSDTAGSYTTMTDDYGTYYQVFTVDDKCFGFKNDLVDEYTLKVTFDDGTGKFLNSSYQDLIESIKIQFETKQVLPDDNIPVSLCR